MEGLIGGAKGEGEELREEKNIRTLMKNIDLRKTEGR